MRVLSIINECQSVKIPFGPDILRINQFWRSLFSSIDYDYVTRIAQDQHLDKFAWNYSMFVDSNISSKCNHKLPDQNNE